MIRYIFCFSFLLILGCNEKSLTEEKPTIHLDFEAAKAYFPLVEKIQNGDTISIKEWDTFFSIKGNRLFLEDLEYTEENIVSIKESITSTYQPKTDSLLKQNNLKKIDSSYRYQYKENHQIYQDYIAQIERTQVAFVDTMMVRAKAFLPKDLEINRAMPIIYYHALSNSGKATIHNRLFISIMGSYERSGFSIANLEAHELHHNFRPDLSYYKLNADSTHYYKMWIQKDDQVIYDAMKLALNEGLADMVDLEYVLADTSKSKVKDEIIPFLMEEGEKVVGQLNENFKEASLGVTQDWQIYDTLYMDRQGHIPGYFMAKTIKDKGRLEHIITHAESPFVFFLTYQEVALTNKNLPVFDNEVIQFIKRLKSKYEDKHKTTRASPES